MTLAECILYVNSRFTYKADDHFIIDKWSVMREVNNTMYGDCEDYSLTVFWLLADQNLFTFLFNLLITHKYKMYQCKTKTGESHLVGSYGDKWFDNWTYKALPKDEFFANTGHRITFRLFSPMFILQLIKGFLMR